jgi:DNA-binding transcriptional LysR family regulator
VTFELFEDTTAKLAQQLEDGTLDLVIASGTDESPNLARHSLGGKRSFCWSRRSICSRGGRASDGAIWRTRSSSFCMTSIRSRSTCASSSAANDLKPELVLRGAQLVTIARMVAAGLGVTVIPEMMAATEFVKDCVAVPFAKPVPTRELTLLRNPLRAEKQCGRGVPGGSRGRVSPTTLADPSGQRRLT